MPVSCSTSALTGQEGSIFFKPAGTSFCLEDFSDFPAGLDIFVPFENDYRIGDPVVFTEEGAAQLDSALATDTTYYITAIGSGGINVSLAAGGTPITLAGDGGTGASDTPGAANHINISIAEFAVVCQVREFSIEVTREELDVTTLPCSPSQLGGKWANFRKTQPGFATGTGTMTVYFTDDQASLANRLLQNTLLKSQEGAEVKLYVNTVSNDAGGIDDAASLYIESDITVTSLSTSVNPDDPTSAELSFNIINPKTVLGAVLG